LKRGAEFANSSYLRKADYDPETMVMSVTFNDGTTVDYSGVPLQTFASLERAPSAGQFFHRHVKGRYNVAG
jgi:lysyl-tRNA synthetase class 2